MTLTTHDLDLRRGGITGSDIAAICGIHPYRSPMDVYLDKLSLSEPLAETEAMKRGRMLEIVIAEAYEQKTGKSLLRVPVSVHPEIEFMRGTPDCIVENEKLGVELKTAGWRQSQYWGEPGTDKVPEQYLLQCAWYMAIMDYPRWDVVLFPLGWSPVPYDNPDLISIYPLSRDLALEKSLLDIAQDFWDNHVLKQTPPEIDGSKRTADWLAKTHNEHTENMIPATEEARKIYLDLINARAIAKSVEQDITRLENSLKAVIGDNAGISGDEWRITWMKSKDVVKCDWKQIVLESNIPQAAIDKYTTHQPGSRRFLIHEKRS